MEDLVPEKPIAARFSMTNERCKIKDSSTVLRAAPPPGARKACGLPAIIGFLGYARALGRSPKLF